MDTRRDKATESEQTMSENKPATCQHCNAQPVNYHTIAGKKFWYCQKHYNEMKRKIRGMGIAR